MISAADIPSGFRRLMNTYGGVLLSIIAINLVVFFPILFQGKVLSANDIFTNFEPWKVDLEPGRPPVANQLLSDIPTGYFTLMALAKKHDAFQWNPYIACGIPGIGSAAAGIVSPLVLVPLALVPLTWIFTAIVFVKLNVAFVGGYLWLREERMTRAGATIGALVLAAAGAYTVRWLWQITNATALYPYLLWIARRAANKRPVGIATTAIILATYALAGFPATIAYGAWVAVSWGICLVLMRRRHWRQTWSAALRVVAGAVIAGLLATPFIVPFVQLLQRSGYLEMRKSISTSAVYPLHHWKSFLFPDRLGNPADDNWRGDEQLAVNNYVDATIYVGCVTWPLVLGALFRRRRSERWFWFGMAALVLAGMFGAPVVARFLAGLPGIEYSPLARLTMVLPVPVAYLAAYAPVRSKFMYAISLALAIELGLFAQHFSPYIQKNRAEIPATPMTQFLQSVPRPFRVAPFFDYLWPNTSELIQVEDIRSHFGSEALYRKLITRIDPSAWTGKSTILRFNSLHFNFNDTAVGLLGVRWYIEPLPIDIIKWTIFANTVPDGQIVGTITVPPEATVQRTVTVEHEPCWAIEVPCKINGTSSGVKVRLTRGSEVWERIVAASDVNAMERIYVPARAHRGETFQIALTPVNGTAEISRTGTIADGDPIAVGIVKMPLIFESALPDGRLFRNLNELPRFRPVSRILRLTDESFLAKTDVAFEHETVVDPSLTLPLLPNKNDAVVKLEHYTNEEQRLVTQASKPFFLASSEKLTPELLVSIDGVATRPTRVDLLFAGVVVPAGRHTVVFSRRLARGWWWASLAGVILLLGGLSLDVRTTRQRRALAMPHR